MAQTESKIACEQAPTSKNPRSAIPMPLPNPFNTLQKFSANGASHAFYSLPALEQAGFKVSRLPVSIRLVLESLLRNADGKRVSELAVRELASWNAHGARTEE